LALNGGVTGTADRLGNEHFSVVGHAFLEHHMGRTWSTSLGYDRRVETAQLLFQETTLTDTVTGQLHGLISRSLGFHASAQWEQGQVGFTSVNNGLDRASANAGLQWALGRHYALGADYSYYHANFGSQVRLPVGLPSDSASHGVQVYFTAWAPLMQKRGRPNATR